MKAILGDKIGELETQLAEQQKKNGKPTMEEVKPMLESLKAVAVSAKSSLAPTGQVSYPAVAAKAPFVKDLLKTYIENEVTPFTSNRAEYQAQQAILVGIISPGRQ